jgi:1-acyl-sn-glycerol-3-phosphate acyltransferase
MTAAYPNRAALVASATCHLGLYELSARLWGPSRARAISILQHWGRRACAWLRLDVRMHGQPAPAPCLYLANHRSYLDIPLLAGLLRTTFLSRADIGTWPVVGPAARAAGVVFVARDDPYGRAGAARALLRRAGSDSVVVFPEGTTHGGRLPGPFHAGLFRLLHRIDCPIVPVTIRYSDRRAYWIDDISLAEHVRTRVLRGPRLTAEVHIGAGLAADAHGDPESLAAAAYDAICAPIDACGEMAAEPRRTAGWG